MKGLILSFRSEFYKTRKTMAFWSAMILPFLLCLLIFVGFYSNADKIGNQPSAILWIKFAAPILAVMGSLILPMLIVFISYSVNNIEHKSETWKTLFSLPISKFSVYSAKYLYALFLVLLCLALFVVFTLGFGNFLGTLKPTLHFSEYSPATLLTKVYFKLFLSALGILSIQFLLSLLFRDFLKPMGIGFVCAITGAILAGNNWKYDYLFPYCHPMMAIQTLEQNARPGKTPTAVPVIPVDFFTKDIIVTLIVAVVVFIGGYFIVLKKSIK